MSSLIGRAVPCVLALVLALGLALGVAAGAEAAPKPKPGMPSVHITSVTFSAGYYTVVGAWQPGANTVSFIASITAGGATLASSNLTGTSWSPQISAKPGTTITLTVRGVNSFGQANGPAGTDSKVLPDLAAPTGSFAATWPADTSGPTVAVTFTKTALADDGSPASGVKVEFWSDRPTGAVASWTAPQKSLTGATSSFVMDYPASATPKRYAPAIRLTDLAGNVSEADVNAVIMSDAVAPAGTARLATATGWTGWTPVTLTTSATDNLSPAAKIRRTISWGDGTTTTTFGDAAATHLYAAAGSYQPTVSFADEAQPANVSATVPAGTVVIRNDVSKPSAALTLPRSRRTSVRSWKVLRGTSIDHETAVRSVRVKVVQKRGHAYYAYVPAKHGWVRAGKKARALAAAGYLQVATTGAWSVGVPKLTTGVLLYRVEAVDVMGNVSAVVQHRQRLTKR